MAVKTQGEFQSTLGGFVEKEILLSVMLASRSGSVVSPLNGCVLRWSPQGCPALSVTSSSWGREYLRSGPVSLELGLCENQGSGLMTRVPDFRQFLSGAGGLDCRDQCRML